MITPDAQPKYRFPNLKPVIRQYVVRDDLGRYGIAYSDNLYHEGVLFAHPADVSEQISPAGVKGAETLPTNAILMTDTAFHFRDGVYQGTWYDYTGIGQVPSSDIRTLTIISDLGYLLPDSVAAEWLTGSDQMGHWDNFYAKRLGKKGGSSTTAAKKKSSAANGKLGGRPRTQKR
jgi:hypothetical protein